MRVLIPWPLAKEVIGLVWEEHKFQALRKIRDAGLESSSQAKEVVEALSRGEFETASYDPPTLLVKVSPLEVKLRSL